MARVASSTTTSRRGSTRPAILRNPSRLMRAPPAPPQANGGMYLGGRTSSKTFAPVPITVPVPSSVPIAVFAWSPIRLPSSCRPVSRRVPASSRRTRPYVFFKFDVIVPAPRFAQRHDHVELEEHVRSEEHTSELQSPCNLVCRLLLEKKKNHAAARATSSAR